MTAQSSNYSGSNSALLETVELADGTITLRYVLDNADPEVGGITKIEKLSKW